MSLLKAHLAGQAIEADPDLSPADQPPWPVLRLVVVAVATIAALLAGAVLYDQIGYADPVTTTPVSDDFESDGALTAAVDGRPWTMLGGEWTAVDGRAMPSAAPVVHTALLDAGASNGEVAATLSSTGPGAGLVFRWVDENNYWALLRSGRLATWLLMKTVDGRTTRAGITGLSGTGVGTRVSVLLVGDSIHVLIGGVERLSVTDLALADATIGGIQAMGGLQPAAFDNVIVRPPATDPP